MTEIYGESEAVKKLLTLIDRISATRSNVLIVGESGTGKELVARRVHERSPNKDGNFVPVNCGAIPENLIESELFGHKKGSFTGAVSDKTGLFETAHHGTLFLDEVGELPLLMQVKLLRAIQEKSVRKVGGNEDVKIETRLIAATNRDLEIQVREGNFREDLYYRLNVIQVRTPPLRHRDGDVIFLANHFLKSFAERVKKPIKAFSPEALDVISKYQWPGNVRELENVIERATTLENGDSIGLDVLPQAILDFQASPAFAAQEQMASGTPGETGGNEIKIPAPEFSKGNLNLDDVLGQIEKMYLVAALKHAGGVKKRAAELLGITFRSIRYRLKKLGIDE